MPIEKGQSSDHEEQEETWSPNPENAKLKFMNYIPRNKLLRIHMADFPPDIVNEKIEEYKNYTPINFDNDEEIIKMTPQKANWDLKRDLDSKIKMLEGQTQNVLSILLKEKLKSSSS